MAIVPLQLARVSNALKMSIAQRSLTRTHASLLDVQNQLASGKRINTPSDDPAGASAAAQLRRVLQVHEGYAANLQHATSHLSQVDGTLGDLTDMLRQAQSIASANVSSTVTADERDAAAEMVANIYTQMIALANRQFEGAYLFGGDRADRPPFADALGGVKFVGSEQVLSNTYDESTVLPFMISGSEVFGGLSERVRGSVDLTPVVTAPTRLTDLRGASGQGVRTGSIMLSNGATSKLVDLSGADTVQDVINAINAAGIGGITAAIRPDGRGLLLNAAPADNITVTETGGTTAADLGILTTTAGGAGVPVTGQPLSPRVTLLTRLADLRDGAGIDLAGGLIISDGTNSATVDLSGVSTVEGLLNAINGASVGATARINADQSGIDVLNSVQGLSLSIAENGGTTAADLGIRSFTPQSTLAELNGGQGVRLGSSGPDLQITRRDGTSFQVELGSATTIQDVINAINAADAGGGVTAGFSATGNGIILTDATGGAGALAVSDLNFSKAASDLGIAGSTTGAVLSGRDVNGIPVSGAFSNLARLRNALMHNDTSEITAATEAIRLDLDRVVRIRGRAGAAVKDFEQRQQRLEDQNLATESLLSSIEDADYNSAVARFQTLQTALQANLQTTGRMLNLSLLDFLE